MKFIEAESVDTFNASDSRQSSSAHHKKQDDISYPVFYFVVLMTWASNCASNLRSSADLRTDDARSASPDSEQIEPAGAKPLRRNSVSVEQIKAKVLQKTS